MSVIPLQREVEYPESDGKPMAESDIHLDEMVYLREALKAHFRAVPDAATGKVYPRYEELRERLDIESAAREQAEARLRKLEEELERLRGGLASV